MDTIVLNRLILFLFIILNFFVYYALGKKKFDLKEYALANRSIGTHVLAMTLSSTLLEADQLMMVATIYTRGIIKFFCATSGSIVAAMLLSYYVFPKIYTLKNCYTLGDVIEQGYGPYAALWATILSNVFSILVVSGQLIALSYLVAFFALPLHWLIIFVVVVTVYYSLLGGVRSVAATDVVQFICLFFGVLIVIHRGLYREAVGGIYNLFKKTHQICPDFFKIWDSPFLRYELFSNVFYGLWPTTLLSQPVLQRVFMAQNKKQIREIFTFYSFFTLAFHFMILLLAMMVIVYQVSDPVTIGRSNVLGYLIEHILSNKFSQGLLLLAMVSIIMSTIDSHINGLVVSIRHDWLGKMFPERKEQRKDVYWIGGILGFLILIFTFFLIKMPTQGSLLTFSISLLSMIVLPFLAYALGFKGNSKIFLVTSIAFLVGYALALFFDIFWGWSLHTKLIWSSISAHIKQARNAWFFASLLSAVAFFSAHYLERKKWPSKENKKAHKSHV